MHYVFDAWMTQNFPGTLWCRYADDGLVHCASKQRAEYLLEMLRQRFNSCGLELHSEKTKIVCCADWSYWEKNCARQFGFLGYSFRLRKTKNKKTQKIFQSFQPGISKDALKSLRRKIKYEWRLKSKTHISLAEIAKWVNPIIRGWFQYYGQFSKEAILPLARYINEHLRIWAVNKFQKLWRHRVRSHDWLHNVYTRNPNLFAHWKEFPVY